MCANFPHGRNDDWVDAMTQALLGLSSLRQVLVPEVDFDPYYDLPIDLGAVLEIPLSGAAERYP